MKAKLLYTSAVVAFSATVGGGALAQDLKGPEPLPAAPLFEAMSVPDFLDRDAFYTYQALDAYNEPDWVAAKAAAGEIPSLEDRLPPEPLVFLEGAMPDGVGDYGGVLRHVIGGRPEGWNWMAFQTQGWGGVNYGLQECLTRTGPLWQVKRDQLEPLPNLATDWTWSDDGKQLTMNLIEGVKWSDGDPFDAEDIMFYWEDNVLDSSVPARASAETFGDGTTLEALDDHTIRWTFESEFPSQALFAMAFISFCPGPSHILKPEHPKYNANNSYDDYINVLPPDRTPWVTLGAWSTVDYRPDDIIVLRRNPYYWKVDEQGNQLPYIDEVHYRLSTWADRTVQAVAGTGDFSNMEQPQTYVEALKRSAEDDAPARLNFGPRILGYMINMNLSTEGWGEPDERGLAVRDLNRKFEFRRAVSQAIDREAVGQSLVRGPFTATYPGGIYPDSLFYDPESVVFYPYDPPTSQALLAEIGLTDTDGDGFVNYSDGPLAGQNVEITLLTEAGRGPERTLAENVVALMEEIGLRVIPDFAEPNRENAQQEEGSFDWHILRGEREFNTVIQQTDRLAPVGPLTGRVHKAGPDGQLDLLPFETEMVEILNDFIASNDSSERAELASAFNRIYTENIYTVGLTVYPGALIINKRFRNVPAAPILSFQWAEDSVIRERMWVPADLQIDELFPETLPQ